MSLNINFLNTSKTLNTYSKILYSKIYIAKFLWQDFFEICSSKKKNLDNLDFLNILTVRIGSGTLKATGQDWSGDV